MLLPLRRDRRGPAGPPWPGGAAWIDGRYRPVEEAKISVLDLGVTRSDGTYDVVHVWDGRFFRLEAHLDRFAVSLARLRLHPGYDRAQIEAILHVGTGQPGPLTRQLRDRYWASLPIRRRPPRSATTSRTDGRRRRIRNAN